MSQMKIEPYITFNGRTEEALEFYKTALDAEILCAMRFSESPEPPPPGVLPEGYEDKIMHALFTIEGCAIMASDGCGEEEAISGISLSISVETEGEARKYFEALAGQGTITMPLGPTFWSPLFGMVKDQFGVQWMIGVFGPDCMS